MMIDPQKEWDMVSDAWDSGAPECAECENKCAEYYTDTGYESWCLILQDNGNPQLCPAYDRLVEEEMI